MLRTKNGFTNSQGFDQKWFAPGVSRRLCVKFSQVPYALRSEAKFDGYRIQGLKSESSVRLLSRRGNDFTKRFAKVAEAVSKIKAASAVLDGEVVVVDEKGQPSFQMLHK
jgi:ATP-dependent DNA ligase